MVNITDAIIHSLADNKTLIIKEIVKEYNERFHCSNDNLEELSKELDHLFNFFLENMMHSYSSFSQVGLKIELYRLSEKIKLEDFLVFIETVRLIIESWIQSFHYDELQIATSTAYLNKFFLDLQRELTIQLNQQNTHRLEKKNAEVEKLRQERVQILSKLSNSFAHELRSPLTTIKGFIQLLESRSEKPAVEKKFFDYINREIKELEVQVNQILYLSDKKNHEDSLMTNVSMNQLVLHVLKTFQPIIMENSVQLEMNFPMSTVVRGNEDHLKLAIFKLFQNAMDALLLKDQKRRLRIKLFTKNAKVILCVENNGPPIPSNLKHSIFDPFVSTKELGKGLGLPITKQIIEKHNGTIYCQSEQGWTSFAIVLPFFSETDEK